MDRMFIRETRSRTTRSSRLLTSQFISRSLVPKRSAHLWKIRKETYEHLRVELKSYQIDSAKLLCFCLNKYLKQFFFIMKFGFFTISPPKNTTRKIIIKKISTQRHLLAFAKIINNFTRKWCTDAFNRIKTEGKTHKSCHKSRRRSKTFNFTPEISIMEIRQKFKKNLCTNFINPFPRRYSQEITDFKSKLNKIAEEIFETKPANPFARAFSVFSNFVSKFNAHLARDAFFTLSLPISIDKFVRKVMLKPVKAGFEGIAEENNYILRLEGLEQILKTVFHRNLKLKVFSGFKVNRIGKHANKAIIKIEHFINNCQKHQAFNTIKLF